MTSVDQVLALARPEILALAPYSSARKESKGGRVWLDANENPETPAARQPLLNRYPDLVQDAAREHAPQMVTYYLRELAEALHGYYNVHQFLVDDAGLRDARLALVAATGQVLKNGLGLLGVSAPDKM